MDFKNGRKTIANVKKAIITRFPKNLATPSVPPSMPEKVQLTFDEIVSEVTHRLLSAQKLEEKEFYREVVKIIENNLNCETGTVFLLERGELNRKHASKSLELALSSETFVLGTGLAGRAIFRSAKTGRLEGKVINVDKADQSKLALKKYVMAYRRYLDSRQVRHVLCVPINGADKPIGVLRAMNKFSEDNCTIREEGFDNQDVALLSIIANLVAIAVEARRNRTRLEELEKISNLISRLTLPTGFNQAVADALALLLQSEECFIYLVDRRDENLNLVATTFRIPPASLLDQPRKLSDKGENGLIEEVVLSGEIISLNRKLPLYHKLSKFDQELFKLRTFHSMLLVPLKSFDETVCGVIQFLNKEQPDITEYNSFSQEDQEIAKTIAALLGNIWQRERHFHAKKLLQNNLLKLGTQALSHLYEPEKVLQSLTNNAKKMLGADIVCLFPYSSLYQGTRGFKEKWLFISQNSRQNNEAIKPPRPNGITQLVQNNQDGYALIDLVAEPHYLSAFLEAEQIVRVLGVRIKVENMPLGVLYFDYRRPVKLEKEDIRVAKILAHLIALILYNAETNDHKTLKEWQLLRALEEEKEMLDSLNKYLTHLAGQLDEPLAYGMQYLYNLTNNLPDDYEARLQNLICVGGEFHRQIGNIEKMLKTARLATHFPQLHSIQLVDYLDDLIYHYAELAEAGSIQLVCKSGGLLPEIQGDRDFLTFILDTLISKAISATPSGGFVQIYYGAGWRKQSEATARGKVINRCSKKFLV
jgi:GAF domain-containing protein